MTRTLDMHTLRRQALEIIRDTLIDNLHRYMPASRYRDFYGWALSADNPEQDAFCRVIALNQLAVMTAAMLGDLGEPDDWPTLVRHAIPVNLYQVFEVVSDNLGLGLARVRPDDPSAQRDLLVEFNNAMITDLRAPSPTPAAELLAGLRPQATTLSASKQSLVPGLHAAFVHQYAKTHEQAAGPEFDRGIWFGLVANVESGNDVLARVDGTRTADLIRDTTIDRYQAVNRILQARQLCRLERAVLGTHAILVVPTLGYFAAVLGEMMGVDAKYLRAVENGSLLETLSNAALLVRLQNDIGTGLLKMTPEQQRTFLRGLPDRHSPPEGDESALTLLARAARTEPVLNRIGKDLRHGEFNVCLYELDPEHSVDDGLAVLADSLAYFTNVYARHRAQLAGDLAQFDTRLRDRRITALIRRFIVFHEEMYARRYDGRSGDYAV